MLFSEVYSNYFNVVAAVLTETLNGNFSEERLNEIIRDKAFSESVLYILPAVKSGDWKVLDRALKTPVKHKPTMPLTVLQKQWLRALLSDPRITLFGPSAEGLEDVEPLYRSENFEYFDRYSDGDPYKDEEYIAHFRTVLEALRSKRKLRISFTGGKGGKMACVCIPYRLEYSSKDDKFRLNTAGATRYTTINIARITECALLGAYSEDEVRLDCKDKKTLVMELKDERNALERAMLHFSYLEKETERLNDRHYRITLHYSGDDETEVLISVLSFGPMLRVISPESFIDQIKDRLNKQKNINID